MPEGSSHDEIGLASITRVGSGLNRPERVLANAPGDLFVSTGLVPRALAYRREIADGFVALVDHSGARIVAEGPGYTDEAILDAAGEWLYVNKTFATHWNWPV